MTSITQKQVGTASTPYRESKLALISRYALALLLIGFAVGQLLNIPGFIAIMETYQLGGNGISTALAWFFIVGEVVSGVGLLLPLNRTVPRWWFAVLGLVVAVAWSFMAVQGLVRGLTVNNCGCYGVYLGQRLTPWILLQDAYFTFLAYTVLRGSLRASRASNT